MPTKTRTLPVLAAALLISGCAQVPIVAADRDYVSVFSYFQSDAVKQATAHCATFGKKPKLVRGAPEQGIGYAVHHFDCV